MAVDRSLLPPWIDETILTDAQLRHEGAKLMRWRKVVTHPRMPLSAPETAVLLVMSVFMNADCECRVSLATIADCAKLSRRHVTRAVGRAVELGFLRRRSSGPGKSDSYRAGYPLEDPRRPPTDSPGSPPTGSPHLNGQPPTHSRHPPTGSPYPPTDSPGTPDSQSTRSRSEVASEGRKKRGADAPPSAPDGATTQHQGQDQAHHESDDDWLEEWAQANPEREARLRGKANQ